MPVTPHVYCDLDDVKSRLFDEYGEKAVYNDSDNKKISQAISASTRFIENHTHRKFYATDIQERKFTADFNDMCILDDCIEIISVEMDIDGDGVYEWTLSPSDYTIEPANFSELGRPIITIYAKKVKFTTENDGLKITGRFGYSDVTPDDIQEACIINSIRLFKRKDAPLGVAGPGSMGQLKTIPSTDHDVLDLLEFYIRHV